MHLFRAMPIHELLQSSLKGAARDVEQLGLTDLSNPALAGLIEKLWAKHRPEVPIIFADQRHGEEREERVQRNDYGQLITVPITYVDVSVPYKGDGNLFNVMPSTSPTIDERFTLQTARLAFSLNLNEASKQQIDRLLGKVEANLQRMRTDVEDFGKSALEQLSRLATDRRIKLAADADKMRKLGF